MFACYRFHRELFSAVSISVCTSTFSSYFVPGGSIGVMVVVIVSVAIVLEVSVVVLIEVVVVVVVVVVVLIEVVVVVAVAVAVVVVVVAASGRVLSSPREHWNGPTGILSAT